MATYKGGINYYKWHKIPIKKECSYTIEMEGVDISMAYLSGNEDVLQSGVCYLEFENSNIYLKDKEFKKYYDTPYREQYHFVPIKNWINDPNGLCWYKGYYHLFYQANPHKQEWNDMYWGHSVSKDLVNWVHLPFVLEPQECLYGDSNRKGGAFSGSAVVLENEVVFYLTRHDGPQVDGVETKEWQTMTRSSIEGLVSFEKEKIIIDSKPEGVGHDFRDPKVIKINDLWHMVIACNYKGNPSVLLYTSKDMENWVYRKPLLIETEEESPTFECPDFFEIDGKYVLVAALMKHFDQYGRFQTTRYYIGDFINEEFIVESKGCYDFGSNFYAVQSFVYNNKQIAIGWISDFYNEHIEVENGAYGSFSIPRVLRIENKRLCMEPIPEIYTLKDKTIIQSKQKNIYKTFIEGNSYYCKIIFNQNTDFEILLAEENERKIMLQQKNNLTKIITVGVKSEKIEFVADITNVYKLEIFIDRRLIEVFINNGEVTGSKLFYKNNKEGCFAAEFMNVNAVEEVEVCLMKSIW